MARAEGILRLLIIDDSLTEADAIINILRSAGHAVRAGREDDFDALELSLSKQSWDLLICRDNLPALAPVEIVNVIKRLGKDLPCVVITENKAAEKELFRTGVQDVVFKDDTERLKFAVERELDNLFMRRLGRRNERALRESENVLEPYWKVREMQWPICTKACIYTLTVPISICLDIKIRKTLMACRFWI